MSDETTTAPEGMMTYAQAAAFLGLKPTSVQRLLVDGKLEGEKGGPGRTGMIVIASAKKLKADREAAPHDAAGRIVTERAPRQKPAPAKRPKSTVFGVPAARVAKVGRIIAEVQKVERAAAAERRRPPAVAPGIVLDEGTMARIRWIFDGEACGELTAREALERLRELIGK